MQSLRYVLAGGFAALTFGLSIASLAGSPEPTYSYASQTGRPTLDQGESGSNPFASALTELLSHEVLAFDAFRIGLIELTERKSRGFQRPEVLARARESSATQVICAWSKTFLPGRQGRDPRIAG